MNIGRTHDSNVVEVCVNEKEDIRKKILPFYIKAEINLISKTFSTTSPQF